jgi:hypothetical protein
MRDGDMRWREGREDMVGQKAMADATEAGNSLYLYSLLASSLSRLPTFSVKLRGTALSKN